MGTNVNFREQGETIPETRKLQQDVNDGAPLPSRSVSMWITAT